MASNRRAPKASGKDGSPGDESISTTRLGAAERNRLIEQHTEYVRGLAGRVHRDLGADLDMEELVAYGMRGLVEAADRFDPTRGAAFTTFSYYRIRGAIYDGLRQIGWLNRSQYARFQSASNELLQSVADRPDPPGPASTDTPAEQAAQQLTHTLDQIAVIFVTSLDEVKAGQDSDTQTPDAAQALEHKNTQIQVRRAVERLPQRERDLIGLYYFQDFTLEAAGKKLGMSKSWTSRLHARAVQNLTELLDPALAPSG